ncbi:hypothetical protein SK571_30795 [Lentzea sp. BCCO 10_0798]|uniref:Uncharacterized protein n=1 Tax=Lentzea kristufekii TaxID=3095430 RepID=A0ABU4TZN5_9PSEU|nr:hypothetical protein [Lentzea sp. BCCO 10_0798]MDX8053779.1 hypothetical protein [Lentzea sp. BCCO 10_0798]
MSTRTPDGIIGLAGRAVRVARAHRAADRDGFLCRNNSAGQWNRWARRARVARTIASALQMPVDSVIITDDPQREYRTRDGTVPGDLITVTEHLTGRLWRFIPDNTTPGTAWLLLDSCPDCGAEIPVVHVAGLADLGDYLDPGGDLSPIAEARDDSLHAPGCTFAPSAIEEPSVTPHSAQPPYTGGDHRVTT